MLSSTHKMTRTKLFQRAVRAVYPYGRNVAVRRGPLKGWRLIVSPSMSFSYIWHTDAANWEWVKMIRPGFCVYDVGANFGQSALYFAHAVGTSGRVICFEPLHNTFLRLRQNIEANDLQQVTVIEAAVADSEGRGQFEVDALLHNQGRLASNVEAPNATFTVSLVTLDSYRESGWPPPDLIKIDVEGGAAQVLAGAGNILETVRPLIYIELHGQQEHDAVGVLQERFRYVIRDMQGRVVDEPRRPVLWGPLLCRPT
jgi:FkbM family methyltransferase